MSHGEARGKRCQQCHKESPSSVRPAPTLRGTHLLRSMRVCVQAGQPKKQKRNGEGLPSLGAHEDKEHGGRDCAGEEDDGEGFPVEAKRLVLGSLDGRDELQTGDSAGEEDDEEGFSVEAKRPVLGSLDGRDGYQTGDSAGEEDDEDDGVDPWTALRREGADPRAERRKLKFRAGEEYVKRGLEAPTPAQLQQFTWEDQGTLQRFRSRLDAKLRELLALKGMAFPEVTFLFGPLYLWLRLSRCKQKSPTDGVWYKTVDVVQIGVDHTVANKGHGRRLLQELAWALTERNQKHKQITSLPESNVKPSAPTSKCQVLNANKNTCQQTRNSCKVGRHANRVADTSPGRGTPQGQRKRKEKSGNPSL
eukprot:g11924.t1